MITSTGTGTHFHGFFHWPTSREVTSRSAFCLALLVALVLGAICCSHAVDRVGRPFAGFLMKHYPMTVSAQGVAGWSGVQAGLRPGDRILEVDRIKIASGEDLQAVVASRPVGAEIHYLVGRGSRTFPLSCRTMQFSLVDLLLTFGLTFSLGLVYLLLGTTVFVLKPDTSVSWVFFGAATLQAITLFVDFDISSVKTPFTYLIILSNSLMPALLVHFSLIFPVRFGFIVRRRWLLSLPYGIATLIAIPLLLLYPTRPFYTCYIFVLYPYIYASIIGFLASLSYSYFTGISLLARQRARTIFWGAAFAFPLPVAAAIMINVGKNTTGLTMFTNLTIIPSVLFPVAIAYSITRHNLFDVDVYIKRAVGYGLMTAIVGTTYFTLQVIMKSVIVAPLLGNRAEYAYPVIFALLVVFLFNPVNRVVQDMVDRLFFRKQFDYKEAVTSVSEALSSVLNLDEIVRQIMGAVRKEMFIDSAGVIVLANPHGEHRGFRMADREGGQEGSEAEFGVPAADPLVSLVSRERKIVTTYDVAEDPRYAEDRDRCGRRFAELDATIAIPMVYQDRVNAVITVGRKKSGHFYGKEDIELLMALASHGAVSIENARLAEQMKKEEIVRTNLSRYLSPQVVDGIVKSDLQVNLGGDRKVVTVLFSDIRDFTTITENRPPDHLVRHLNEYFTAMAEVIFQNQGSLDKYIGDAIVAVFGSLIPLENPESHAVSAAIGMMRRLQELNREWGERGDFTMEMGIGINTGEVFLGNIGSSERMEFTVIGDTVNVASRFSSLARAGQILVTDTVATRLDGQIRQIPRGASVIKGKAEEMEVHEIRWPWVVRP